MAFKPAERSQVFLKIALTGASGSGKTYSALELAQGIGKRIAVIDTENRSASLYADRFKFETDTIEQPYTIDKYLGKIREAIEAGFDVVIVDSLSHAWAAEGGILDRKAKMDERGGNSFANWNKLTPEQERLKAAILNAKIHMICTMRSKQEYVLEENDRGKQVPKKLGMAPIQRDDLVYEFTTVFDVGPDHVAVTSKDRTGLFDAFMQKLNKSHGKAMLDWLLTAKPAPQEQAPPTSPKTAPPAEPPRSEEDVPNFNPLSTQPKDSGVACAHCGTQVIQHETKTGFVCPNAKERTDKHTRFLNAKLKEFREKQPYQPDSAAVSQGA
jgi:hypothetical protein